DQITGFAYSDISIAGKWADLLKQMVPSMARVAYVYNLETSPQSPLYVRAVEAAGLSLGVEIIGAPVHSTAELEATLARVAHEPNVGLIVSGGAFLSLRAKLIVDHLTRHQLPAIVGGSDEAFMAAGGLMQYSPDPLEPFRLAPFYVDRILKGTKPGDLPVHL